MPWISPEIRAWLTATENGVGTYRHATLSEDAAGRAEGLRALGVLTAEAHRDARERLERLLGQSLDPLMGGAPPDWPPYPDALHTTVLQGYLGEVLAGIVAENYDPHGRTWVVPAFLFRGHLAATQALERQRQLGGTARPVPGRTGDDVFAFCVNDDDAIVAWLLGEAKCTHDHSAALITAAHEQLSLAITLPVDLLQLIEVLDQSHRDDRHRWIASIRELMWATDRPPRFDMCIYVCGRAPIRNPTWIPADAPHPSYSGSGPLEAVEVHLHDFDEVVIAAYPLHRISRA